MEEILKDAPVGYYRFEEGTARNLSTAKNPAADGVYSQTVKSVAGPGAIGGRMATFDGKGHVTIPHEAAFDSGELAVEFWFRSTQPFEKMFWPRAPEAVDLSNEPKHMKALYGLDDGASRPFGEQCLKARRLVERGVRFVQLYHGGGGDGWDTHGGNDSKHLRNGKQIDKPITRLITDLKARGLLDSTLVIWGGEFGRTPTSEGSDGRDHSPYGYSVWMAGGGIRGGTVHGSTRRSSNLHIFR